MSSLPQTVKSLNDGFVHDEAKFRKEVAYDLTPTSLKGVYLNPVPPADFDMSTASQADLTRHGMMWRKPAADSHASIKPAWEKILSHKDIAAGRIVPEFAPQIGVTHILKTKPEKQANGSYLGAVWAGAGGMTGSWTSIIGQWNVPTVSKPPEAQGTEGGWNSSSWIGLDGFFISNDVLQAGVQQHVAANGVATYVAWYEWFAPQVSGSPAYIFQTNITNMAIHPGDSVYCSVQYVNKTSGSISFMNQTTKQNFAITLAPPPGANFNGSSYEWIVEAPDGGELKSSLPKFTPVTFGTALACGPNGAVANPNVGDTLNIRNPAGKVLTKVAVAVDQATVSFIG